MKRGNPRDFGEIILTVVRPEPERHRDAALVEDAVIGPAADVPDHPDRWRQLQSRNEDILVLEPGVQANAIGVGRDVILHGALDGNLLWGLLWGGCGARKTGNRPLPEH